MIVVMSQHKPPPDARDEFLKLLPKHPLLRWALIALVVALLLSLLLMSVSGQDIPDPISPGVPHGLGSHAGSFVS